MKDTYLSTYLSIASHALRYASLPPPEAVVSPLSSQIDFFMRDPIHNLIRGLS